VRRVRAALLLTAIAAPVAVRALDPFEIQVYQSDVNEPGQFGLEAHLNYTASGTKTPEYPGQIPPDHVARFTLEPAVGVTDWLEVGAYLQFMLAPGGLARYAGWKLRAKFVVPERTSEPFMLGVNVEVSKVPEYVEEYEWASELRPILGYKVERWLFVVNPIVSAALAGPDKLRVVFEPAAKVAYDTRLGFAVGAEYYSTLGYLNDIPPLGQQEHLLFGVVDLVPRPPEKGAPPQESPWELNVGVGAALTSAPGPQVILKAIVGRTF
jgi:hypothetical protein